MFVSSKMLGSCHISKNAFLSYIPSEVYRYLPELARMAALRMQHLLRCTWLLKVAVSNRQLTQSFRHPSHADDPYHSAQDPSRRQRPHALFQCFKSMQINPTPTTIRLASPASVHPPPSTIPFGSKHVPRPVITIEATFGSRHLIVPTLSTT